MPKKYLPLKKAETIQYLLNTMGDVLRTHRATGIPERTLYEWKREYTDRKNSVLLQHTATNTKQQVINAHYERIRDDLIMHIHKLSDRLGRNPANAAELAIALSRLLDRLTRMEGLIQETATYAIVILYEHPDGTVHDTPIWERIITDES